MKFDEEISYSDSYLLAFTLPVEQLFSLAKKIPGEYVVTPLCKLVYPERDSDFMLILREPNGYRMAFHDLESWSTISKPDMKAPTRLDLSLHIEARYTANGKISS